MHTILETLTAEDIEFIESIGGLNSSLHTQYAICQGPADGHAG